MTHAEIQEWLADFENRISFLENSLPGSAMSYHPEEETQEDIVQQDPPWTRRQWDIINQLRSEVKHIHGEVHEKRATQKSKKYNQYEG